MKRESGVHRAEDGTAIHYTRLRAGRERAILVAPGILMHRESAEHRGLAEALAGIADVVTLDVRGHGDSGGAFTWGGREPEDVAALALGLRGEYARLGGLGFSFGGYHTAVAAATRRPYDAVALVSTPQNLFVLDHNPLTRGLLRNLPLMLRRRRRLARLGLRPRRDGRTPLRLIADIAPVPLLVVQGTDDWLVPVAHARRLFARAGEPKELRLIEGGLHAEYMLVDEPRPLLDALRAFFERTLA